MWAALLRVLVPVLNYGGTAAAGWALGDYFNETKKAEAAQGTAPTPKSWFQRNWGYFIVIIAIVGALALIFKWVAKKLKIK